MNDSTNKHRTFMYSYYFHAFPELRPLFKKSFLVSNENFTKKRPVHNFHLNNKNLYKSSDLLLNVTTSPNFIQRTSIGLKFKRRSLIDEKVIILLEKKSHNLKDALQP